MKTAMEKMTCCAASLQRVRLHILAFGCEDRAMNSEG
jgi:hypothetical protein